MAVCIKFVCHGRDLRFIFRDLYSWTALCEAFFASSCLCLQYFASLPILDEDDSRVAILSISMF
jgi:hypothetical protein